MHIVCLVMKFFIKGHSWSFTSVRVSFIPSWHSIHQPFLFFFLLDLAVFFSVFWFFYTLWIWEVWLLNSMRMCIFSKFASIQCLFLHFDAGQLWPHFSLAYRTEFLWVMTDVYCSVNINRVRHLFDRTASIIFQFLLIDTVRIYSLKYRTTMDYWQFTETSTKFFSNGKLPSLSFKTTEIIDVNCIRLLNF